MNVSIALPDLQRALRVILPALGRANPLHLASCGWIAADDRLTLHAVSLDWDVRYRIPAAVRAPGTAWIPADLMRVLPWTRFHDGLTVHATDSQARLSSGDLSYTARLTAPETFRVLRPGTHVVLELGGPVFAGLLQLGAHAHGRSVSGEDDDHAEVARGAWLYTVPTPGMTTSTLRVDSTDGFRTARASLPLDARVDLRIAIPVGSATTLARAAQMAETVTLSRHTQDASPTVTLETADAIVTVKTLGVLPPDLRVLDRLETPAAAIRLQTTAFIDALRSLLVIAGTDPNPPKIRLTASGRTLSLRLQTQTASAQSIVPATIEPPADATVLVSGRALLSSLEPLAGATVALGLGGPDRPVHLSGEFDRIRYSAVLAATASRDASAAAS